LAKELIELNDLELEVKSEVGLGTTFSVAFWKLWGSIQ
jgi:hypothetical protein